MLPTVVATRFVAPLREGGSMPGLMEASDEGMYVVKFRGAGQGLKTLVAEVLAGQIAARAGVAVPGLAIVDVPGAIARYEADEEVQDLLDASLGLNLGLDFLPGAHAYDGTVRPDPVSAARLLWVDAYTANVDRTWSNPNLLVWHGQVYAIDHGAALYFHHAWPGRAPDATRFAAARFDASTHVLAELASDPRELHDELAARLDPATIAGIVDAVPQEWLEPASGLDDPAQIRAAYREHLSARLASPDAWLPGAAR